MKRAFGLSTLILMTGLLTNVAFAQSFIDPGLMGRSCGEKYANGEHTTIACSSPQVTEPDRRVRPSIEQPVAQSQTMGLCGRYLPSGQDYNARTGENICGGMSATNKRLPMPVDQDKKDKADQVLNSAMDDLTKRTKAQELLRTEIQFENVYQVPLSETWTYVAIEGDFNGPEETYETTCKITRVETYTEMVPDYDKRCTEWVVDEPEEDDDSSGGGSLGVGSGLGGGSLGGSSGSSRSGSSGSTYTAPKRDNSDRLQGTSSSEIEDSSRSKYKKRKGSGSSYKFEKNISREIAQSRRCVNWETYKSGEHKETKTRDLSPVSGNCKARRGTWRTFPVTRTASRSCGVINVKVKTEFSHDRQWNAENSQYLDILPNKFDLLPGESEEIMTAIDGRSTINASAKIDNAWNDYHVLGDSVRCSMGDKELSVKIETLNRIKRKAPNPFAIPEGREPFVGVDEKGRPNSLALLDLSRNLRLDASQNSRRFEDVGTSEAGGSKKFWIGTQFSMKLYKVDGAGRRFLVTLPNRFTTDATDIFENEMQISLGGKGGMDRLYRPAGPLQFIFGYLYGKLGVELSPDTNYVLEVKAAQREFPFYESTCSSGDVSCGDEKAKDSMFSEAIKIPFKTGDTKRSFLKWLKDKQIVIF